ncbi:MAG TPA: ATP-binding protein [Candidatus Polarisedimenticolaceae bacterium]|nr:ATP-binding protein [Candidatus Polarisedimenticolaceae bacterium]
MTETARLAALRSYRILDTEPERAFDDLALLASRICGTPIALITLVDRDRQWVKSGVGVAIRETSREVAFCHHAIQQHGLFTVPDATRDARFRDNPFVTSAPKIRFYTGAPLVTPDGHALGTLCVLDHRPRTLTSEQKESLDALRRQVMAQLTLRRNLEELKEALAERDRIGEERERLLEELRKLSDLLPLSTACQFNLVIPADARCIPAVVEGVMKIVREKRVDPGREADVEIALCEALANAVKHGCGGDPTKHVQCCVAIEGDGELLVVVRDPGEGFDPQTLPSPVAEPGIMKSSGRGVFLINQFMDEVRYEDGGRTLHMRKRPARPADH